MSKKLRNRKRMRAIRWWRHFEKIKGRSLSFTLVDQMVFREMQTARQRR